jgi:hypothetical protein
MDPISNVDQLVLLLRQKILEKTRTTGPSTSARRNSAPAEATNGLRALAAIKDIDDREIDRALVQDILAGHFGRELFNEAPFQQVVTRVTEALRTDPGSSALLSRVVGDLRKAAR